MFWKDKTIQQVNLITERSHLGILTHNFKKMASTTSRMDATCTKENLNKMTGTTPRRDATCTKENLKQ